MAFFDGWNQKGKKGDLEKELLSLVLTLPEGWNYRIRGLACESNTHESIYPAEPKEMDAIDLVSAYREITRENIEYGFLVERYGARWAICFF